MDISKTELFQGITREEIKHLLHCLQAEEKEYKKDSVILSEGSVTERLGMVLSGMVILSTVDVWGNGGILTEVGPGEIFGETYAAIPDQPLLVDFSCPEPTKVLFLHTGRILRSCSAACDYHSQLAKNLLTISAKKNLKLSRRILHTGSKTIRGRLLSYFSECSKKEKNHSFEIPFNRQQLADYLGVDRSALSNELSKMQKDGMIEYKRNTFLLKIKGDI